MRILLLTQWFEPEPTFKGLVFAKELVRLGHEVEVVTGFPNYPGGKIYPGYKIRWLQHEVIDGVRITRVPLYPSHDGSALKRIANYLSFAVTASFYCLFGLPKVDVVHAYHPPLTIGIIASLIKFLRRIPVVYDIHDLWPDTLESTGMISNKKILLIVNHFANWIYRHMDHITMNTPGYRRRLSERSVSKKKMSVIYGWCDEKALECVKKSDLSQFPGKDKFRILFAGTMGKAQALGAVLDAADQIKNSDPRICFIFVGGGVELDYLKETARNRALPNVVFLPKLPMNQIGGLLQEADVLLVHLKKDPLFEISIPGKTQAYMAMGKPILMAVQGDAADLVKEAKCAIEAISEDSNSIADAAKKLASFSDEELTAMGHRAKTYYNDHLALKIGVARFAEIFKNVVRMNSKC